MNATKAWQRYQGERISALDGLPVGVVAEAELEGEGIVHLHKHKSGAVLIYGRPGLGAPLGAQDAGGGTSDAALTAAVQAMLGSDPCTDFGNPAGNPGVRMFQVAWNNTTDPSMGTPALAVDGKYGPNTAAAAAQALGGQVPAPCKAAPGPQPQPQPQPQPTPPAPTPTNYVPWILGGLGVLALGGVAFAVLKKPSSKEQRAAAHHHDRAASAHRLRAHLHRRAAHLRAREEAAEAKHRRHLAA